MARINLLPWRQEERERKNKEFVTLLVAVAALTALVVLVAMSYLNSDLSNQQSANAAIVQENERLDEILTEIDVLEQKKEEMLSRIKVVQDLQGRRSVPVRIWADIASAVPDAMYLTSIVRDEDAITIMGYADNANVVSQFVRSLDASSWLANSGVPNIQTDLQPYQQASRANLPTNRPLYPEDNYIQFTVTTLIKADEPAVDEDGNVIISDEGVQIPVEKSINPQNIAQQPAPIAAGVTPEPVAMHDTSINMPEQAAPINNASDSTTQTGVEVDDSTSTMSAETTGGQP